VRSGRKTPPVPEGAGGASFPFRQDRLTNAITTESAT
jgi:hypothetical protein